MNDTREKGKIIDVFRGKEDHGILTINIGVEFEGGSHQGFGNLCLDSEEMADDLVADLCAVFNVKKLKDLVGKKCYALRCSITWTQTLKDWRACLEHASPFGIGVRSTFPKRLRAHWSYAPGLFSNGSLARRGRFVRLSRTWLI
jgi:hypothetical protein